MKARLFIAAGAVLLVAVVLALVLTGSLRGQAHRWSESEAAVLRSLWIESLPPLPPDPSNRVADDLRAARLGHALFFDTRFSANSQISCATCHQPERAFSDGLPRAVGIGLAKRSSMPLIGAAYSPWFFADGSADSLWAQALGPLENPLEHAGSRTRYAHLIAEQYRQEYEAIFGPLPDLAGLPPDAGPLPGPAGEAWQTMLPAQQEAVTQVYVNMGKALAAYQRKLLPGPARFDRYVQAVLEDDQEGMRAAFEADEAAGLKIFIGKARCIECHNGPLLTNNSFGNVATPASKDEQPDSGRIDGVKLALASPFNCLGPYSDAQESDCSELKFTRVEDEELIGAFRTPTLRNVAQTAPYMHAGQLATLRAVIDHYNEMPRSAIGHNHLDPLELTQREIDQLEAFLRTLDSPAAADPQWLAPP